MVSSGCSGFAWQDVPTNNYIDALVYEKLKQVKVLPSQVCTDEEFVRRIYLDLTGLRGKCPPSPDFVGWLRQVIAHRRTITPGQTQADIRAGIDECLRFGTTLVGDIASGGASWDALAESPLRAACEKLCTSAPSLTPPQCTSRCKSSRLSSEIDPMMRSDSGNSSLLGEGNGNGRGSGAGEPVSTKGTSVRRQGPTVRITRAGDTAEDRHTRERATCVATRVKRQVRIAGPVRASTREGVSRCQASVPSRAARDVLIPQQRNRGRRQRLRR